MTINFDDLTGPAEEDMETENMRACDGCGSRVDRDDLQQTDDTRYNRRRWDHAGQRVSATATGDDGRLLFCHDCVETCYDCDGVFRYMSDHRDTYCERCGEYTCNNMNNFYCDECSTQTCEECGPCEDCCQGGAIRSYDWRPPVLNFKGDRTGVMMGVELEVEGRERVIVDAVHAVDDCEDHLYMKHDGSVNGVEIVTHPATLAWHKSFDYAGLLDDMRGAGCTINLQENGIHVHVGRDAFSNGKSRRSVRHQMSWLMFLYRNAEQLQALARRRAGRWASFDPPTVGELRRKAERIDRGNRYLAVNCNNEATYELRFFAATLDTVEFFAALEFATASVEYTRQLGTADVLRGDGMSWARFVAWCDSQGTYPALVSESHRRVPADMVTEYRPSTVPSRW